MSAKQQVTITLGRRGQVVKRPGATSEGAHSDYGPLSGGKRPIRDRLRNNSDAYGSQFQSKRQRREEHQWSSADDDMNDANQYTPNRRIGRNDLRFKLMRKNFPRQMNSDSKMHDVDLRERLSRTAHTPLRSGVHKHQIGSRTSGFLGRIHPTRSADDLLHMDSLRRSYSPGPSDRFRHRSPDRLLSSSRGLSPPRHYDDLRQRSSIRSLDSSRSTPFMGKNVFDVPRPANFAAKAPYAVEPSKPGMRLPPPNGTTKNCYAAEEPTSVSSLLHSLGLGKYAILFQAEEVDMAALKQMGDNDLKELGIPMGPRKKILLALLPRARQQRRT
uniref:SEC23-interacting protein n=2 Tax=Anthurium amnicola TaxID=1678845 RepID=A0A1D1XFI6_9ARAE